MIDLHGHDDDSYLDGACTAFQRAERAAQLGRTALAQTNHGNVNGALKHIKACGEFGLLPICGVEAYWRPNRHVHGQADWQYRRWHLILLAINLRGWHNLLRITSEAFASGFYQNPCIDTELLREHNEGLICTTSCILGPLAFLIENATDAQADAWVDEMLDIFGDRLFFAIAPHDFDRQRAVNLEIISRAHRAGRGIVWEGDTHYIYPGDIELQKTMVLIGMNKTVAEAEQQAAERAAKGLEAYELWHPGLHMMSEAEVRARFALDHPNITGQVVDEAISTTDLIGTMVEPFVLDRSLKMPRVANSIDEAERIVMGWCRERMNELGHTGDPVYENQLEHERQIFSMKNAWNYALLVGRFVRWAKSDAPLPPSEDDPDPPKKRPIRISGRGSGAASLISYLARITAINPINHKLKFERFLNPGRKGLPDWDLDIEARYRAKCKLYFAREYGRDTIADVVSQQTFQARAAIQNVARTYGIDYMETKVVTDQIDPVHDTNLEELRLKLPDLNAYAMRHPDEWSLMCRLENGDDHPLVLRLSKHAAGVVITPGRFTDWMPTIRASEEEQGFRTAWSETPRVSIVDDYGFVKIDLLGLIGLEQQQRCADSVEARTGVYEDVEQLPCVVDPTDVDPAVMDLFARGLTLGVHQCESEGYTAYLKRVKPKDVIELSAVNALYRPGPMGAKGHYHFADRKHGVTPFKIPSPLKEVLSDTFGVLCFQEDTRISVADGREVAVRDLRQGALLHTVDQGSRQIVVRRCCGVAPTRRCDGLRMTLTNNESVVLTDDHEVLTPYGMRRVDSLQDGDLVAVARHARTVGHEKSELASWLGTDADVAYFLGQLVGDGCLTGSGIDIATGTELATDQIIDRLRATLPLLKMRKRFWTRSWYVSVSCPILAESGGNRKTKLHELLERLGMKVAAPIKRIPVEIQTGSQSVRRAFMAGLFDADGTLRERDGCLDRCSITSASDELLRDIACFARAEGIPYTFYPQKIMLWDIATWLGVLTPWLCVKQQCARRALTGETVGFVNRAEVIAQWAVSGESQQAFCSARGMSRSNLRATGLVSDSRTARRAGIELGDVLYHAVKSIARVRDQQFYGLSVEEHHNFIGNGVVLKNCFQEQVMELFEVLVGYSAAQADDVRKEIDKLNRAKSGGGKVRLAARKEEFIAKATVLVGRQDAERLWEEVLPYTGYSFNRPHAACYSVESYQDMWQKRYETLDFYASLLTLDSDSAPRAVKEAKKLGVAVLPPDINRSESGFTVDFDAQAIRYGLAGIKGIGDAAATQVMLFRQAAPYASVEDFVKRHSIKYSKCNKGARDALIRVGTLDALGARDDWSDVEKAEAEAELLGLALTTGGTLGGDEQLVVDSVHSEEEFEELPVGERAVIGGKVIQQKQTTVKKGKQAGQIMCFLTVQLGLDTWSATCFPAAYQANCALIDSGEPLMIEGKKDDRGAVIVNSMMAVADFAREQRQNLELEVAAV